MTEEPQLPLPVEHRADSLGVEPIGAGGAELADAGAARNVLLQLASQVSTLAFTGGLVLYLARALGEREYGVYALAISVAGLTLFPAGLGLPLAVGRYLADHRSSRRQLSAIFRLGMRLQVPAALIAGLGLFVAAGAIADAYGNPQLGWPLRWAALSVVGQSLFAFLSSVGSSVRRSSFVLSITIIESAVETATSIAVVAAGAGAAGATLGKFAGYTVAMIAGIYLALRLLGSRRSAAPGHVRSPVTARSLLKFAGAMFVVDITWSAITQLDVLLIGALLGSAAVGGFSAVLRVLAVLGYVGLAVASGVAPRVSLGAGDPDVRSFQTALRYLTVVQGLAIAPMLVWAHPIVGLLLGPGYSASPQIMRVLTLYVFIGGPAALITIAVTYLGEARRRVPIMIGTLVLGVVSTYFLVRAIGVVGAAVGDDVLEIVYVAAHLWICSTLITLDLGRLGLCGLRTILAAGAMALVLLAFGTVHLSPAQWVGGLAGGVLAFALVLLATRELSIGEIRTMSAGLRAAALGRP